MHFLDKYEDPSALKPTTTGVKGPKLAKKTCTLQHVWRGLEKPPVSMTRFAEFIVKIGGGRVSPSPFTFNGSKVLQNQPTTVI